MFFINCEDTYELLNNQITLEEASKSRISDSKNKISLSNKFINRPKGFILSDSYNHFVFPITPKPTLDTSKFDLSEVYKRYRELYSNSKSIYLPWHFSCEMIGSSYYIFNTRPLDLKFPLTSKESIQWQNEYNFEWDKITELFFKDHPFDIEDAIHICIVGNTNIDIYTRVLYKSIGTTCILPFVRQFKLIGSLFQDIFPLNINTTKFKPEVLVRFMNSK